MKATERQLEILHFIIDFKLQNERSPTFREIMNDFGITVKGAHDHVEALEKKGYVKREGVRGGYKNIRILKDIYDNDLTDDRAVCFQAFRETGIPEEPANWHIWKRAWTEARSRV